MNNYFARNKNRGFFQKKAATNYNHRVDQAKTLKKR